MKLPVPFLQLPVRFDADRLAGEAQALGAAAWREHPLKYPGNFALPLVAVDGDPHNDGVAGEMLPTPYLERCPYLLQVLASLGAVWGHTRLMKLSGSAEVTPHVDVNYYWAERMRVHVPIATQPGVRFMCGDAEVHMGAGECWLFDTWRMHRVVNVADHERIHLVADTVGGDRFFELVARARAPGMPAAAAWHAEPFHGDAESTPELMFERVNVPVVMTPWELREHLQFLFAHVRQPNAQLAEVRAAGMQFATRWHALWSRFGGARDGWPAYRAVLDGFEAWMAQHASTLQLVNDMEFMYVLRGMILRVALGGQDIARSEGETRMAPGSAQH